MPLFTIIPCPFLCSIHSSSSQQPTHCQTTNANQDLHLAMKDEFISLHFVANKVRGTEWISVEEHLNLLGTIQVALKVLSKM